MYIITIINFVFLYLPNFNILITKHIHEIFNFDTCNFSISVLNSYPQSAWFWQNPVPTGEQIFSVIFQNTDKGFAVGYGGEILKSTNGGMNWLQQASPSSKDLNDIHIINTGLGFICGDSGIVLKTENAGQTWTEIQTPTFNMLESIWCVNDEIIIAAGNFGTVLRSTDRGNNWSKIVTGITNNLRDICFVNSDSGVIVGHGVIYSELQTAAKTGPPVISVHIS